MEAFGRAQIRESEERPLLPETLGRRRQPPLPRVGGWVYQIRPAAPQAAEVRHALRRAAARRGIPQSNLNIKCLLPSEKSMLFKYIANTTYCASIP